MSFPSAGGESRRATGEEVRWYARREIPGPWYLAACPAHAPLLRAERFAPSNPPPGRTAPPRCALCERPGLLDEVRDCTCEHDPAKCAVHQNIGCGG